MAEPTILERILASLDEFAVSLADRGHVWTPRERELYEQMVREVRHA